MTEHRTKFDTPSDALRAAFGAVNQNQSEFARICGCTQGAVWQLMNKPDPVLPPQYVLKVEAATGVPRWELRPDIYPPDLAAGPEAPARAA